MKNISRALRATMFLIFLILPLGELYAQSGGATEDEVKQMVQKQFERMYQKGVENLSDRIVVSGGVKPFAVVTDTGDKTKAIRIKQAEEMPADVALEVLRRSLIALVKKGKIMKRRHLLTSAISSLVVALPAFGGVQTMTSDEMVETYVKDSAVIVVPKERKKSEADRQRILRSLTISPGEPVLTEAEEEAYREALQRYVDEGKTDALENAEDEFLRRALLLPQEEIARAQPPAEFTPTIPPIIFGQQAQIPEEPFTQTFLNDQLGIGFDGQNLNFSIGNPPGIDQIQVPQAINEGPITLTPRPGGGFDLSIAVPDQ